MELAFPTEINYNKLIARIIHLAAWDVVTGNKRGRESGLEFMQAMNAKVADVEQWHDLWCDYNNIPVDDSGALVISRTGVAMIEPYHTLASDKKNWYSLVRCCVCGREFTMRKSVVRGATSCGCLRGRDYYVRSED